MALDRTRLWAKGIRDDESVHPSMYLLHHLQDVCESAIRVLDSTADSQLTALGLDPKDYAVRLRRCVLLASAVHDIGKANNHFQDMLLGRRYVQQHPQGMRHEWVAILMLTNLKSLRISLKWNTDSGDLEHGFRRT